MKKLFLYLLKKYSKNEKGRIEILKVLDEQVSNEYTEQTGFGNVYNGFSEFVLASSFIKGLAKKNQDSYLAMIKNGIIASFDEVITIIKDSGKQ